MSESTAPRQLRLIVESPDFDEAVTFFRDVLGMPEQPAFATTGDDRVSILHAGSATIEIASVQHVRNIDEVEGAPPASGPTLRLALEVDDTTRAVESARDSGLEIIAPPVETPFRSLNARVAGPAGWQVTFFQELETLERRSQREGFHTDDTRAH
ncbi:glyoxalase/bleomycin resistance/extradiol dioxygenase family protein [Nocardioides sp.]|uniref:VOC family protein n=1 Tax=Nocardioides sp. TaxID=35761 RepID=UPI00273408EF|nr:VOC family protein [Nocardioides sp.]MDP3892846.1 VOC family protein [Nocardioides sp.]